MKPKIDHYRLHRLYHLSRHGEVLGASPVGEALARALEARGHSVDHITKIHWSLCREGLSPDYPEEALFRLDPQAARRLLRGS